MLSIFTMSSGRKILHWRAAVGVLYLCMNDFDMAKAVNGPAKPAATRSVLYPKPVVDNARCNRLSGEAPAAASRRAGVPRFGGTTSVRGCEKIRSCEAMGRSVGIASAFSRHPWNATV